MAIKKIKKKKTILIVFIFLNLFINRKIITTLHFFQSSN